MAKKKQQKASKDSPTFEEALADLEAVVHDLEHGELGLAEALERYELGVNRLKQCQKLLEKAELRIEVLTRVDAQGNAITRPLDEKGRGRKRNGPAESPSQAPPQQAQEFDETDDLPEAGDADDLHHGPERGLF